jgi:7,8-dihydro-6-hydroxymethylpterin-pyrophosphokinase
MSWSCRIRGSAGGGFVLAPLAEIRPGLILPGQTETVSQLLKKLPARRFG